MSAVATASAATSCGRTDREYRAVGSEIDTAASARPSAPRTARPIAVTVRDPLATCGRTAALAFRVRPRGTRRVATVLGPASRLERLAASHPQGMRRPCARRATIAFVNARSGGRSHMSQADERAKVLDGVEPLVADDRAELERLRRENSALRPPRTDRVGASAGGPSSPSCCLSSAVCWCRCRWSRCGPTTRCRTPTSSWRPSDRWWPTPRCSRRSPIASLPRSFSMSMCRDWRTRRSTRSPPRGCGPSSPNGCTGSPPTLASAVNGLVRDKVGAWWPARSSHRRGTRPSGWPTRTWSPCCRATVRPLWSRATRCTWTSLRSSTRRSSG